MSHPFIISFSVPIALLALPLVSVNAQPASLQGPIAGYVFSPASETVRPLLGVPGSAYVAPPVLYWVDSASIAPGGKWAIVTRSGQTTFVSGLSGPAPAEFSVGGIISAVDRVVWSRDGSFALLYSSSGSQFQRVQFSGSAPLVATPVDVSTWGPVTTLAIDPAGMQIAVGFAASGLYLFAAGQTPALLLSTAHPAAAAFDGTGQSLYAIDLDAQQIVEFQSGSGVSRFVSLAQPDGASLNPVGLAVSGNGLYLSMVDSATQSVFVYETGSASLVNTIPLNLAPSRFEALSGGPLILLNGDDPKQWLLILDASQSPALYFVPAVGETRRVPANGEVRR